MTARQLEAWKKTPRSRHTQPDISGVGNRTSSTRQCAPADVALGQHYRGRANPESISCQPPRGCGDSGRWNFVNTIRRNWNRMRPAVNVLENYIVHSDVESNYGRCGRS